ncbi:MAG: PadR family transcriptional regulator [Myxococcales bacterium]
MSPRTEEEFAPLRPGEFLVLASLQRAPLHGYGISQAVRERTYGRVRLRPGNLYRVLDRLLERGLVEPSDRRPARDRREERALPATGGGRRPQHTDERRQYYRLTPQGRRALAQEAELLADVALEVISLSPAKA